MPPRSIQRVGGGRWDDRRNAGHGNDDGRTSFQYSGRNDKWEVGRSRRRRGMCRRWIGGSTAKKDKVSHNDGRWTGPQACRESILTLWLPIPTQLFTHCVYLHCWNSDRWCKNCASKEKESTELSTELSVHSPDNDGPFLWCSACKCYDGNNFKTKSSVWA